MQLEQMFGYQPRVAQEERQQTYFVVGDLENLSASALYMAGDKDGNFKFLKDGLVIPVRGLDTNFHDTYNIDKDGNVSNGHSTVNLPRNGKVYMPFGTGKPSIKSGS